MTKNIISAILNCHGGIINIIRDNDPINKDFILFLKEELEKNNYNVIYYDGVPSQEKFNNLQGKNLIIINFSQFIPDYEFDGIKTRWIKSFFRKYFTIKNNNILLILNEYANTTNTNLNVTSAYSSSMIMLLKNGKISTLKSIYEPISSDILYFLRKQKLKKINNIKTF